MQTRTFVKEPSPSRPALVGVVAAVLVLHLIALWGVLQINEVRQAVASAAPVFVRWIAPPVVEEVKPQPPVEEVKAPPQPVKKPPPVIKKPIENKPVDVKPVAIQEAPPQPAAPSQPPPEALTPLPAMTAAPAVKTVAASEVRYLERPRPLYPQRSLRLGEEGQVLLRVLISVEGRAQEIQIISSSGSEDLDAAARAAIVRARFVPYSENGIAQAVWAQVPITFAIR